MASRAKATDAKKAVGDLEAVVKLVRGRLEGSIEVAADDDLEWIAPGVVEDVADLRFRVTELEQEIRREAPRAELLKAGQALTRARLELQEPQPDPAKVIKRLKRSTQILTRAAESAKEAKRLTDRLVRWTVGAAGLWQLGVDVLEEK